MALLDSLTVRCVRYRDLAEGQEFRPSEFSSEVFVKVGTEHYAEKDRPNTVYIYEKLDARSSMDNPRWVWIE